MLQLHVTATKKITYRHNHGPYASAHRGHLMLCSPSYRDRTVLTQCGSSRSEKITALDASFFLCWVANGVPGPTRVMLALLAAYPHAK